MGTKLISEVPFKSVQPTLAVETTTDDEAVATQMASVPPFVPVHVQFHGPAPVTVEAVPTKQRPVDGACVIAMPFAEPQTPSVGEVGGV